MMMAGHFCKNLESSGDLNRPRSPEVRNPRRVFAVLFARRKKYQSVSLTGKLRGSSNLDSARRNGGFALTKLKPSQREIRGFPNLESAHPNNNLAQTKLNPFSKKAPRFRKPQKTPQKRHFRTNFPFFSKISQKLLTNRPQCCIMK